MKAENLCEEILPTNAAPLETPPLGKDVFRQLAAAAETR